TTAGRSQRRAQLPGGLQLLRMGLDIPGGHVSAGVYNARILPAQAVQQRLVIGPHRGEILLRVAFRRHQK
ncbi:DUF2892 domain-containing protein, partial [Dysosmobacter welbionis]